MQSYMAKPAEAAASRKWWVIDAKGQSLGRLASTVARVLRGKHKATFTPHVDTGDFVIIVNARQVRLTGSKAVRKMYYRHSGYPGGIHEESYRHLSARMPDQPIKLAVRGMLPKNTLGRQMLRKLRVYPTAEHPHQAQKPEALQL
jgi:large subunit ribosomal protein L13